MPVKMNALASQCFAGGFIVGVKKHFNIVAHVSEHDYGMACSEMNFPKLPHYVGPEEWPLDEIKKEKIDFIFGNPPCAAWSPLGRGIQTNDPEWWRKDPRIACTKLHFTLLHTVKPTVWATESVTGAWTKGHELFEELAAEARPLGYKAYIVLHNAQWLGADQHRKRMFCVFSKVKIDWHCPFKQWTPCGEKLAGFDAFNGRVEEDGLNAIDVKMKGIKQFLKTCPQGSPLRHHHENLSGQGKLPKGIKRFGYAVKRLHPDKPAPAMIGASFVHPYEDRFLTISEMLHLGGFPPGFKLKGSHEARAAFLGRGVLPPVGAWLAQNVKKAIAKGEKVGRDKDLEVVDFMSRPGV
jgi:site-specific DNA-cytosine methylase